jgi:parallel beta-helix repeat protein
MYRLATLALLGLMLPAKAFAAESQDSCKGFITSLPATISTSGTWCLQGNLTTTLSTGNAITVTANDVTLDCNDAVLDNSATGAGTKRTAIRASTVSGLTVRHCGIRGFQFGIYISGTGGSHLVEDNHVHGSTYVGIWVAGDGSVVRRNAVLDIGGSTATSRAYGIYAADSVDILDNTVSGVYANSGDTFGIRTDNNASGSIADNRVKGILKNSAGVARGIHNQGSGRITLRSNNVSGNATAGTYGITCSSASGRAKDNIVVGFPTPLYLCGNAGGNDLVP